jgi:hypothetical protein
MKHTLRYVPLLLLPALHACGDAEDGPTGSVEVRISGQAFAKQGWPITIDGETLEFEDGWSVRFEHVIASVSAFRLGDEGREVIARNPPGFVVDLQKGDFVLWNLADVPAQRFRDVGYQFTSPAADAVSMGSVPEALIEAMRSEGYALFIQGTGEKQGRSVTFQFGIPGEVTTSACLNGHDETDGVIVGEGRTARAEITLHMDHLFWDDHDAEEPRLLFGPLAYAAGDDDLVTLDELAAQRLTDLHDADGAPLTDADDNPIVYVPRVELPDNNLREYLIDTALTLGHFNGEGHCAYDVRP